MREYFVWLANELAGGDARAADGRGIWLCRTHAWDFAAVHPERTLGALLDQLTDYWLADPRC